MGISIIENGEPGNETYEREPGNETVGGSLGMRLWEGAWE